MTTWPTQGEVDTLLSQWKAEIAELQQMVDAIEWARQIFDESFPSKGAVTTLNLDPAVIRHCRTQREALQEIAKRNGGIVRVREAAPLILAAGLSQAKLPSITSTAHNLLNGNDEWEYVEPGTFRLVDFTPTPEEVPEEEKLPEEIGEANPAEVSRQLHQIVVV